MYILDTDHFSIIERGGRNAKPLLDKLKNINPQDVCVTVITYEEQIRGWMSYINKSNNIEQQVQAYQKLKQQLGHYCQIPIINFDLKSARKFEELRKQYRRIEKMDLKIASIAIINNATILTRNSRDFGQINSLFIENWTI